jgi:hypothetical protein
LTLRARSGSSVTSSKGWTSIPTSIPTSSYNACITCDGIPLRAMMLAKRKCARTFHHLINPYRNHLFFSQASSERGALAGYRKNTVAGLRKIPIPIHLLRLNLQLYSLHSHTQLSHTTKMAELTHPTIKDGKTFQPARPNGSPWNCSIA